MIEKRFKKSRDSDLEIDKLIDYIILERRSFLATFLAGHNKYEKKT